eukprot:Gb_16459 [translate_table: standard]
MGKPMSSPFDFVRIMGVIMLWTACPHEKFASARDPRLESGERAIGTRAAGNLRSLSPPGQSVGANTQSKGLPAPAPAPAPSPVIGRLRGRSPHHAHKSHPKIPASTPTKNKWKSAKRVGYVFVAIAGLLQVALVFFLLVKRKQMIGLVNKYDETRADLPGGSQDHWNGIHTYNGVPPV